MEDKFYKWVADTDVYCARVVFSTADYYKNGDVYALQKEWIHRESDIEITMEEFHTLIEK